jgi:hypothetical protein
MGIVGVGFATRYCRYTEVLRRRSGKFEESKALSSQEV